MQERPAVHVLSYQESGVAWVPWRIAQLVNQHTACRMVLTGRGCRGQVRYGLPYLSLEVDGAVRSIELFEQEHGYAPDVLHLHHDWVAQRQMAEIRNAYPDVKVLITSHGEPDRHRIKSGAGYALIRPDGYHVVSADLLPFFAEKAGVVRYIPNHPGRSMTALQRDLDREVGHRLFVPFSNVPRYKNVGERNGVMRHVEQKGGVVYCDSRVESNDAILETLAEFDFVWVQLQGYAPDLLTQEAWSRGCIPIVASPDAEQLRAQAQCFGELPPYPFVGDTVADVCATMDSLVGSEEGIAARKAGLAFMRDTWAHATVAEHWDRFYREVAAAP